MVPRHWFKAFALHQHVRDYKPVCTAKLQPADAFYLTYRLIFLNWLSIFKYKILVFFLIFMFLEVSSFLAFGKFRTSDITKPGFQKITIGQDCPLQTQFVFILLPKSIHRPFLFLGHGLAPKTFAFSNSHFYILTVTTGQSSATWRLDATVWPSSDQRLALASHWLSRSLGGPAGSGVGRAWWESKELVQKRLWHHP